MKSAPARRIDVRTSMMVRLSISLWAAAWSIEYSPETL